MYGEISGANAYHAATGNAAWADLPDEEKEVALVRASALIDGMFEPEFIGKRTAGVNQDQAWPRRGAAVLAAGLLENEIPDPVIMSAYELAWIWKLNPAPFATIYAPGTLLKRKTVGPITKEFAVPTDLSKLGLPEIPLIRGWLSGLLRGEEPRSPRMPVLVV